jgi:Asp-tRNA(Asn)/Glu-tRNA(Gln) amidotransferase A subunit family amidase
MPMYGVVFSFNDPFDTKDMRTTAGGDAAYDIDFPARDHILVEQLRRKGAITCRWRRDSSRQWRRRGPS